MKGSFLKSLTVTSSYIQPDSASFIDFIHIFLKGSHFQNYKAYSPPSSAFQLFKTNKSKDSNILRICRNSCKIDLLKITPTLRESSLHFISSDLLKRFWKH